MPLAGLFDAAKETDRLQKQEAKVQKALAGLQGRLANRSFLDNAAPAVVQEVKQQQVIVITCGECETCHTRDPHRPHLRV